MKKLMISAMLTSTLVASTIVPFNVISAQTAAKAVASVKSPVSKLGFVLNDVPTSLHVIATDEKVSINAKEISKAFKANLSFDKASRTVTIVKGKTVIRSVLGSETVKVNNADVTADSKTTSFNGATYIDVKAVVEGLGGSLIEGEDGKWHISTVKILSGGATEAQWVGNDSIIVKHSAESGTQRYRINVLTKEATMIADETLPEDAVISPFGSYAAYITEAGAVTVVDLETKQARVLFANEEPKSELQWSASGDKLYFVYGQTLDLSKSVRTNNIIAELTAAGTYREILNDSTQYKTDLRVSNDGNTFTYNAATPSKVTVTGDPSKLESYDVKVDATGTEPQVYSYNATTRRTTKLTNSPDNKLFNEILPSGQSLFVSYSDKEGVKPILRVTDYAGLATTDISSDVEIIQAEQIAGKVYILAEINGAKSLHEVNLDTKAKTKIADVPAGTNAFHFSPNGAHYVLEVTTDTADVIHLSVNKSTKYIPITK